jgi:hypothetical protein
VPRSAGGVTAQQKHNILISLGTSGTSGTRVGWWSGFPRSEHPFRCSVTFGQRRKHHGKPEPESSRRSIPHTAAARPAAEASAAAQPKSTIPPLVDCPQCMALPAEERHAMKPAFSGRMCQASGCENPIPRTMRAGSKYCSDACRQRGFKVTRNSSPLPI